MRSVTTAPEGHEGEGFPVRRAFAGVSHADLDPFVHMDQMGEIDYAPYEPKGTDWHPHRGFETVTYIMDGTFVHQDSHGGGGTISNGATQWMTAGNGILHIETPPEELVVSGGLFHGVQLWVNLPGRGRRWWRPPTRTSTASWSRSCPHPTAARSCGSSPASSAATRARGAPTPRSSSPTPRSARAPSWSCPGIRRSTRWPTCSPVRVRPATSGARCTTGQLVVFGDGDTITLTATGTDTLDVLLLGGEPIGEPVVQYGPFVMNTKAEVQQAFEDYQRGLLGTVPADGIQPFRGRRS